MAGDALQQRRRRGSDRGDARLLRAARGGLAASVRLYRLRQVTELRPERVRVYSENGKDSRKNGVGLFTAELLRQMPWLPVEEDGRLQDAALRENFIERVYALYELNMLWRQGLTRGGLIAFHSRYKLSLLAHSQPAYRELGRFVADIHRWDSLEAFAVEYRSRLMALLAHKATRRNHTNVLMHVQGYFRRQLSTAQRRAGAPDRPLPAGHAAAVGADRAAQALHGGIPRSLSGGTTLFRTLSGGAAFALRPLIDKEFYDHASGLVA